MPFWFINGRDFQYACINGTINRINWWWIFCSPIYPVENKVPENFVLYAENVMKIAEVPAEEQQSRLQSIEQRVKQQLERLKRLLVRRLTN